MPSRVFTLLWVSRIACLTAGHLFLGSMLTIYALGEIQKIKYPAVYLVVWLGIADRLLCRDDILLLVSALE